MRICKQFRAGGQARVLYYTYAMEIIMNRRTFLKLSAIAPVVAYTGIKLRPEPDDAATIHIATPPFDHSLWLDEAKIALQAPAYPLPRLPEDITARLYYALSQVGDEVIFERDWTLLKTDILVAKYSKNRGKRAYVMTSLDDIDFYKLTDTDIAKIAHFAKRGLGKIY